MLKINYKHRLEFWGWCKENKIVCEFIGTFGNPVMDIWYIGSEKHRLLAMLRWS